MNRSKIAFASYRMGWINSSLTQILVGRKAYTKGKKEANWEHDTFNFIFQIKAKFIYSEMHRS